eukprot:1353622-Amorphochlora_amoeboformis.AAC.1
MSTARWELSNGDKAACSTTQQAPRYTACRCGGLGYLTKLSKAVVMRIVSPHRKTSRRGRFI